MIKLYYRISSIQILIKISFTVTRLISFLCRFWFDGPLFSFLRFPMATWSDIITKSDLYEYNLRVAMLKKKKLYVQICSKNKLSKLIKLTDPQYLLEKRTSCSQNPCLNDGHCIEAASGSFECVCKPGFSGTTCAGKITYFQQPFLYYSKIFIGKNCYSNNTLSRLCDVIEVPQGTSVFLNSTELTVLENTRKFLRTQEDTIFCKSSSNGQHWKTSVFVNSRDFAVRENERKAQKKKKFW